MTGQAHACWGPHVQVDGPMHCECEIGTDHDHADWLDLPEEDR